MAEVVVIGTAPSREAYDQVSKAVGAMMPAGLIVHTATQRADGTVQIIDVWENRQAADAFGDNVIRPAVERMMADDPGDEPEMLEPFDVRR
jgi:hypothetical protein